MLSSLELLIYKRLTNFMDVFLSEENKSTRPVIVSPANETIEVDLGKWAPVRICWNQFFLNVRVR